MEKNINFLDTLPDITDTELNKIDYLINIKDFNIDMPDIDIINMPDIDFIDLPDI